MTTNTETITITAAEYNGLKKENLDLREVISKMVYLDKAFVDAKTAIFKTIPEITKKTVITKKTAEKKTVKAGCQMYSETTDKIYHVEYYEDSSWTCSCPHFKYRICSPVSKSWGCKHIDNVDMKDDLIYF